MYICVYMYMIVLVCTSTPKCTTHSLADVLKDGLNDLAAVDERVAGGERAHEEVDGVGQLPLQVARRTYSRSS